MVAATDSRPLLRLLEDSRIELLIVFALLFGIYVLFALRETVLDALALLWRTVSRKAEQARPEVPVSCPRCGCRIPLGSTTCDMCPRLGIPPAPVSERWVAPVEADPPDYLKSISWAREKKRDPPAEIAMLRVRIVLFAMVASSFTALISSILVAPPWFDVRLMILGAWTLLAADFVRRLYVFALMLGALPTVAIAIVILPEFDLPPLAVAGGAIGLALLVLQALTPMQILRQRRAQREQAAA